MEWVDKIGHHKVHRVPVGSGGRLATAHPSACLHTTEGSTFDGAVGTIRSTGFAPHFTVGDDQIAQMRPLSSQGAALRAHNDLYIQIEAVGFSKLQVHDLTPGTFRPLSVLAAWLHDHMGIPLERPKQWPDNLGGGMWADNNPRRQSGIALHFPGWVGHIDVPDQSPTWHWDPGAFDYSALFAAAGKETDVGLSKEEQSDLEYAGGLRHGLENELGKGEPPHDGPRREGWKHAQRILKAEDAAQSAGG
jgi:hypothetical protein